MKAVIFGMALAALALSATAGAAGWDAGSVATSLQNGQPEQALAAAKARLSAHPDDPEALFLKAVALADSDQTDAATAIFEILAKRYPQRARVWNNLGVLYARQGELDEARSALQKAIALGSNDGRAEQNLGDVYLAMAAAAYRRAEHAPGDHAMLVHKLQGIERLMPSLPATASEVAATTAKTTDAPATAGSGGARGEGHSPMRPAMPPKATAASVKSSIEQTLTRWARAQSQHDATAYLALYSSSYRPNGQASLVDWIRRRRSAVDALKTQKVGVRNLRITQVGDGEARVEFTEQRQVAGKSRDLARRMVLVREDGGWRIRSESPVSSG